MRMFITRSLVQPEDKAETYIDLTQIESISRKPKWLELVMRSGTKHLLDITDENAYLSLLNEIRRQQSRFADFTTENKQLITICKAHILALRQLDEDTFVIHLNGGDMVKVVWAGPISELCRRLA